MADSSEPPYVRMLAARQRLIDLRARRTERLLRLRAFFRDLMVDFVANVDPISGSRFAEVSADGNKARGDLAVSVTFFEGTKMVIAMDTFGRFSCESNPESIFADIGTVVDVEVLEDLSSATLMYETQGLQPTRRTLDLKDSLAQLVAAAVESVEAEARV